MKCLIILGLHIGDVYKDLAKYYAIKASLGERGYKFCLHGLDKKSFLSIDRQALGFDLLKLKWDSDMRQLESLGIGDGILAKIEGSGSSRVILENCSSASVLKMGQKLGISLFEGGYINQLMQSQHNTFQNLF